MRNEMRPSKTLGAVSGSLIVALMDEGKRMFETDDAVAITGKSRARVADLLYRMVKRGLLVRIKKGKYMVMPQEAGSASTYIENHYVVARELVSPRQYYLSHYSAMAIHGMLVHPVTRVYVSSLSRVKDTTVGEIAFKFVFCNRQRFWGFRELWVTKHEKCCVSDVEKTILDCLYQPQHCGGVSEVVNGIWVKRKEIDYDRLARYCRKDSANVPLRRLGYIIEVLGVDGGLATALHGMSHSNSYVRLDPLLSGSGKYCARWGLVLNIGQNELRRVTQT
jgi:predicted transcriptional regulator of viral defense system